MPRPSRVQQVEDAMLRIYAQAGAKVRLDEIRREMDAIYRTFPYLRDGAVSHRRTRGAAPASGGDGQVPQRRKRRKLTAAERKAIGVRMKKYWAERRKAKSAK